MRIHRLLASLAGHVLTTGWVMAQSPLAPTLPSFPDAVNAFEARVFKDDHGALPYRLLKPAGIEAGKKYPLVLFLHGAGERGSDNVMQLWHGGPNFIEPGMRRRHPAFVVMPQCPAEAKWVDVDWSAADQEMPKEPSPAMRQVFGILDALKAEFPIDDKRLYAVGLSMGGYGTWDILARRPELLAAAVPICGGGDPRVAARFKDTPVWVFHGSIDPAVNVQRSRDMVEALRAAGGHPLYTEYEGVEHNSWTRTFDNRLVWDWLFAQHRQSK
jgi:predicted peptidase